MTQQAKFSNPVSKKRDDKQSGYKKPPVSHREGRQKTGEAERQARSVRASSLSRNSSEMHQMAAMATRT